MRTETTVWITTQFVGYHRWKDAPDNTAFLRDWHRHVFKVKLGKTVTQLDREIEFISLKEEVDSYLNVTYHDAQFDSSCEMIAHDLLERFDARFVEVSEDGENGATVTRVAFLLPALQKKTKCFIGIEAEGPRRGDRVLFVPGGVTPSAFRLALTKVKHRVYQVYYGAGNDLELRPDTFDAVLGSDLRITVEVESSKRFACIVNQKDIFPTSFMLVSRDPLDPLSDYTKTVTKDEVIWKAPDGMLYTNKLDDPLYDQDMDVI